MNSWDRISSALGEPVVSVEIGGVPLRAERYIFQLGGCEVPPLDSLVLACHLGGARATAGRSCRTLLRFPGRRLDRVPARLRQPLDLLRRDRHGDVPRARPGHELVRHLQRLLNARTKAPPFSDPLVNASAQQLLGELARTSTPNLTDHASSSACRT
jgi:AraC family transcriptional regulator